jgi:hypothetical protein
LYYLSRKHAIKKDIAISVCFFILSENRANLNE